MSDPRIDRLLAEITEHEPFAITERPDPALGPDPEDVEDYVALQRVAHLAGTCPCHPAVVLVRWGPDTFGDPDAYQVHVSHRRPCPLAEPDE